MNASERKKAHAGTNFTLLAALAELGVSDDEFIDDESADMQFPDLCISYTQPADRKSSDGDRSGGRCPDRK